MSTIDRAKILFIASWIVLLSEQVCTSFTIINSISINVNKKILKTGRQKNDFVSFGKEMPPSCHFAKESGISEEESLERAKRQLEIMKGTSTTSSYESHAVSSPNDMKEIEKEEMYQHYIIKPANDLKEELKTLKLHPRGKKPDLARRLVDYHIGVDGDDAVAVSDIVDKNNDQTKLPQEWDDSALQDASPQPIETFASLDLSVPAGKALAIAGFLKPTTIQSSALPLLAKQHESLILHAETGSGKTLCYLLPITESLWKEEEGKDPSATSYALILTPTRELAAQVAGIASVLSPPNSVRLITTPSNLVRVSYEDREKSESEFGGRLNSPIGLTQGTRTKIIVGSAKSIMTSLFGDSNFPCPPTSKPEAKMFLRSVKYLVIDEVDRLLDSKKSRGKTSKYYKKHEKPAATIISSIARMTLGQAQVVAASATVGRPLRRELARVLGLTPDECPQIIRGTPRSEDTDSGINRAVTLPITLGHYVMPCDGSTSGGLLTAAAFLVKSLPPIENRGRRTLFVIASGCGIKLRDAIGALQHFGVSPDPKSLLDVMEADGTDNLIEKYRGVSGSSGLGEKSSSQLSFLQSEGYLLLSVEETVRGIHLDDLDTVIIVGRPKGPDEYLHIAGRAGRAGKTGKVVSVLSYEQARALSSWESMLGIDFIPLDENGVKETL